jgi:replicative DNA helicase
MGFEIPTPGGDGNQISSVTRAYRRRDGAQELAFQPGEKPHDLETERAVLAGIFRSSEVFSEVQNHIKVDDFFLPAHQDIFNSMLKLSLKNIPIDLQTAAGYLREQGTLDRCGGAAYLSQITLTPSTSFHAIEYAKIVADLSWRRRLLDAAEMCRSYALKPGDTRDIASEIEKRVFGATQEKKSTKLIKIGDLLSDAIKEFERRADNQGVAFSGVTTGLKDLDECLSGFRPGQLIVLAAGPGTGKTSLAANIMHHAAVKSKKNVLFFSLEMTQEEVVERILAFSANIDATRLRNGSLSPKDFNELFFAADELGTAPMFIDDRSVLTPYDVLAQTRKLSSVLNMQREGAQVDLIVVDYIQIMKSGVNNENRALEVAAITGGLKSIAKEMKVPVLALSQLNRDRAKRTGTESKRPQLSDLKDSGAIEADADVVLFIHREQGPDSDSRAPSEAEIIVAKQRSGPTGIVKVTWLGHLTKFTDYINAGYAPPEYAMGPDPSGNMEPPGGAPYNSAGYRGPGPDSEYT